MILEKIAAFLKLKLGKPKEYKGLADFVLRASKVEKERVFTEAAEKANEDQLRVFKEAELKMRVQ